MLWVNQMDRRKFIGGAVIAGAAGLGTSSAARSLDVTANSFPHKARMKAGHQQSSSDSNLQMLAAFGVNHICSDLPSRTFDENWSVEGLSRLRERVASFGIKLDMLPLPLSSTHITHADNPHIMLGVSPERDR